MGTCLENYASTLSSITESWRFYNVESIISLTIIDIQNVKYNLTITLSGLVIFLHTSPGIPLYFKYSAGIVTFFRGEISEDVGN